MIQNNINYEFCGGKNHKQFKTHQSTKPSIDKNKFKNNSHTLVDSASGVQVGDVEQVIV